ncbi:MAG: ATP-binding protein [Bacteroidota bacterium]|nr:ATP-binding protein [Bacteroidota bacterium]
MKKTLLFILVLATCLCGRAQTNHLYFDKLDIKKGLPESYVRAIAEDSEGYIWIATQNGLVKYDGYNYKVYYLGSDKINLAPVTNVITVMADTINKALWATVAGNGIFRYNRATDTFDQFAYPSTKFSQYFNLKKIDNAGNLWGDINDKIEKAVKFDVKTRQYEVFSKQDKGYNYINAERVNFFVNRSDGSVWLGGTNGLYRYNGKGKPLSSYLTSSDTSKTLGVNPIYTAASQPGIIWMNTFHGINHNLKMSCFDIKQGRIIKQYSASTQPGGLASASVNDIYEDKKHRLWFATETGLSKLDRQTGLFTNYKPADSLRIKAFGRIVENQDGKFWMSPQNNLLYFDPETGKFEYYKTDKTNSGALSSADVSFKLVDHTNALWLGFGYAGANRINKLKSAFEVIKQLPGIPGSYPGGTAHAISTRTGYTRIVTKNGIYDWQNGTNSFKKVFSADTGQKIMDAVDDNQVVYIATSTGFVTYNTLTRKKEVYRNNPKDTASLTYDYVYTIFRDHTGIIWLGLANSQGLCSFNPQTKKITRYPYHTDYAKLYNVNDGSLDDGQVIVMYEDRQNTFWVGTNAGSLNRFDRKTGKFFSYYSLKNTRMTCVSAIYEDRSGRFWVGTYLTGLFEFDPKAGTYIRQINERSGLLFNGITDIKEDDAGRIWIASDRGLTRLNPKSMALKNYKLADILPDAESAQLGRTNMADGRFVLSLNNGLALFNPKDLDGDPNPPVVHLESVVYNNPGANKKSAKEILAFGRASLSLAHDENSITFNYIALHYENPSQNIYACKLEGYDKQWVQAGTNRTITYNNLSPGTYTFRVRAANSSGVWNNKGDSFTIIIDSPWWFKWWAWLLYIVLFATAIYLFINYRSRHLIMENQLLEEKVSIRTKQLSEQQEEIITQRDQLAETITDLKSTQNQLIQAEKMASLGELTAGIAHEIQNPLNFVNNFSEVSVELTQELKEELKAGNTDDAIAIADDLEINLGKIQHHGKRADFIVKGMLQHSRTSTGERQPTNINVLADEFLKLSYHGLRAKDKFFNAEMVTNFDENLPKTNVVQQDIGRVLLNLFNNAFYAVNQKAKIAGPDYKPTVTVTTFAPPSGGWGAKVRDNGVGIPDAIKDKIMQPFFTTKPTGEGTGLGLSLSYDIVVKAHGGKIDIDSKEGEYTEFVVTLPVS